ncbi:hypothetical protein D6833_05765 [Candidatus Parcubacteria bacterium]|nr:MAG: hypothetical protein D6833_05765 [Candidatus Parcubacteria bacterium]
MTASIWYVLSRYIAATLATKYENLFVSGAGPAPLRQCSKIYDADLSNCGMAGIFARRIIRFLSVWMRGFSGEIQKTQKSRILLRLSGFGQFSHFTNKDNISSK